MLRRGKKVEKHKLDIRLASTQVLSAYPKAGLMMKRLLSHQQVQCLIFPHVVQEQGTLVSA